MKRQIPMVLLSLGLAASASLAQTPQTPQVDNAKIETGSAAAGLETAVRQAGAKGPVWIGWTVPMAAGNEGQHYNCCWSHDGDWKNLKRSACKLEGKNQSWGSSDDEKRPVDPNLMVLVRSEGGEIEKVRGFSLTCPLDAGGRRFVWLGSAKPEESVNLLAKTARRNSRDLLDEALSTLAYHRNARADEALEEMASAPNPEKTREQALFWLGQSRGERGARFLTKVIEGDRDDDIREKAIFSLSQSESPSAADTLIRVSRDDRSPKVRGEALFWLAQMNDPKVTKLITDMVLR